MLLLMDDDSPFHAGERAVQQKAGVRVRAEQTGQLMIRDVMSEQQREFFAALPFVAVGSLDDERRVWTSLLTGEPGFLGSTDPGRLDVQAVPWPGDPLARALRLHAAVGLLGIQLETRRRNRVNGRVVAVSAQGFSLRVDQSFGNCPKYITARAPLRTEAEPASPRVEGSRLSAAALACIAACDTCFLASASAGEPALDDPREGVDVSHRGGKPGFVHAAQDVTADRSVLTMPDFVGNNMFNTLGNLTRYPRAGLLFLDFATGDALSVTCVTELLFAGAEIEQFRGAQRATRFHVEAGVFYPRALPFQWSAAQASPQHDKTGSWDEALRAEKPA